MVAKAKHLTVVLPIGVVFTLTCLCVGCDYYKEQMGYLVTHSERFMHHYEGNLDACRPTGDCNREEIRYVMVHKGVKFTVHCESYNKGVSDCFPIQVGEAYQCRVASAFGDQWLDCGSAQLEIDSSQRE